MKYTLRVMGPSTDNEEVVAQRSLTLQELTVALMLLKDGDSAIVDATEEAPGEVDQLWRPSLRPVVTGPRPAAAP